MTRALLITNPAAARTDARAVTTIRETLRGGGWTVEVLATLGPGDARRFAREAPSQGFDVLVCYGGDGTAMQMAAGVVGTGIPLGLVPGGTGNILAGNLRLPRSPASAARALLTARPHAIDLGSVERADGTHYFAVASGAGFDAQLMADTGAAAKQRWKFGAYVWSAVTKLSDVRSAPHRITVDGTAKEVRAAMVLVLNCGELVPRLVRVHRDIAPDDGWLDVVTLRADGAIESAAALWELFRGAVNGGGGRVWSGRGRTIRVEVVDAPPRPVQADGEAVGETPFEARLLPGALSILVPPHG
ncbi:MAG TPA: diacylglycerol kinase family protein [Gemmatimonadales bacterium]|jgi:diacylglycerol kinase family enzyme|nr:diacylglycerol kinase family protein [Gemmatimonadales bacterium]